MPAATDGHTAPILIGFNAYINNFPVRGAGIRPSSKEADLAFTGFSWPWVVIRRCASVQLGSFGLSCSQCTEEDSLHQPASLGMTCRCAPVWRNFRIDSSLLQTVIVQEIQSRSRKSCPPMNPGDRHTCLTDFQECHPSAGRNRRETGRNRVTATKGMVNLFPAISTAT